MPKKPPAPKPELPPPPKPVSDEEQRELDEKLKEWLRQQGHRDKMEGK
jgi:hypothetical protein